MAINKYDFKAWLETKNPDEEYRFTDSCGACLMGQFMGSQGEKWSFPRYSEYVQMILGDCGETLILNTEPQTMGGALKRVQKILEEV